MFIVTSAIDMKTLRNIDAVSFVNFKEIPHLFLIFHHFILEFRGALPAGFTSRDQSTDK